MGSSHSSNFDKDSNAKVERLFRANMRTARSRSLDTRQEGKAARVPGGSQSARFHKTAHNRYATTRARHTNELHPPTNAASTCPSGITNEQKRRLETCWVKASAKQIRKSTEDIFFDILQSDRTLTAIFRLDDIPINRVRDNPSFKSHASNFALVLDLVVKNLPDNIDSCCEALQALGGQHVRLRERGFDSLYWDVFADCFEHHPPSSFKTEADREAWSATILFVVAQMKIGFRQVDKKPDRLSVTALYQ